MRSVTLLKLFFGIFLWTLASHAEDVRISDLELVRRQGFREFVQSVLDFDQSRESGASLAKQGREDWLKKSKDGILEQREQQRTFDALVDESGAAYHSAWRERLAYQQELDSYRQEYRNERAPLKMTDPRWNLPTESQEYGLTETPRVDWKKRKFIGAPGSAMASSNNDYVPPPPPPAVPPNNFDAPPPPPMPPQGEYYDYPPPPAPYYDDQQPQY